MLEVKAIWTVGYPEDSEKKKVYSGGDKFKCDDEWGKKKAKQGKVEILGEVKSDNSPDLKTDITEYTVKEAETLIDGIKDTDVLEALIEQEKDQKEPRVTLISALTERIEDLEE